MKNKNIIQEASFVLPALSIYVIFTIVPLLGTLYFSFTSWDGISNPKFVYFQNYLDIFSQKSLKISLINTFYFAVINLLVGNPLCLLIALVFEKLGNAGKAFQTLFYIPAIMSQIVMSVIWGDIFQYEGVLNNILRAVRLDILAVDWLGREDIVKITICMVILWSGTGFGALFYYAGLKSISNDVMESAIIDGAKGLKKLVLIKIPLIMPIITINLFIGLVSSFKLFDIPFVLTHGGPGDASSTLGLAIYKYAFEFNRYGQSTAIGIVFLSIVTLVSFLQVSFTRKKEVSL